YNPKDKFDIAIVFGGVSMIPYRLDEAVKFYKNKKVKKILVSGGVGYLSLNRLFKEASLMQKYLLSHGVKEEDIIIEDKSRNTYENVINIAGILKKLPSFPKTKIILITSDFHLKRCMELTIQNTEIKDISGIGIEDHKNDIENWHKYFQGRKNIHVEAFLLCYYAKKKRIKDLDIDM
ncbi:MAG: YdcF family protein, partial [Bacilli bacterium]|nr:YdcF family protein [Bacilli bacterium]